MKIYFLRHADAVPIAPTGLDSDRVLTERGRRDMKEAAAGMLRMGVRFDRAVSSPYVRARQTAEITLESFAFNGELEFSESMTPDADFEDLKKLLRGLKGARAVLLVGHNPSIGAFTGRLATGSDVSFEMRKAGLCRIDAEPPFSRGQLRWRMAPEAVIAFKNP